MTSVSHVLKPHQPGISIITAVPIVTWNGRTNGIAPVMTNARPVIKRSIPMKAIWSNLNPAEARVLSGRGLLQYQ